MRPDSDALMAELTTATARFEALLRVSAMARFALTQQMVKLPTMS